MHHNLFGDILIYSDQLEFWICVSVLPPSGQIVLSTGGTCEKEEAAFSRCNESVYSL